jgi:hypothetical protein
MATAENDMPVYYIGGHGGEYPRFPIRFARFQKKSFIVPAGCTIVVKALPGAGMWFNPERLRSFCTTPIEILSQPQDNLPEILDIFGSVAIYKGGDMCPNFNYVLLSCYDNFPEMGDTSLNNFGSGIIDIRKKQSSGFCVDELNGLTILDERFTDPLLFKEQILKMFENSVFPTPNEVELILKSWIEKAIMPLSERIASVTGQLISALRGSGKYEFEREPERGIINTTQSELCFLLKKGVFYNFVCRPVDNGTTLNTLYEFNRNYTPSVPRSMIPRLNSISRTPGVLRNTQLKHLTESLKHRKPGVVEWYQRKYGAVGGKTRRKRGRRMRY